MNKIHSLGVKLHLLDQIYHSSYESHIFQIFKSDKLQLFHNVLSFLITVFLHIICAVAPAVTIVVIIAVRRATLVGQEVIQTHDLTALVPQDPSVTGVHSSHNRV